MPMRGELSLPLVSFRDRASPAEAAWSRLAMTFNDPDLRLILGFTAIGLLLTVCLIYSFPDVGGMAEALVQTPS
ncbi:MAG: hypothetical protein ABSE22_06830 [Xanthobacteraceae bacterium]